MKLHYGIALIALSGFTAVSALTIGSANAATVVGQSAAHDCGLAATARNPLSEFALRNAITNCDQAINNYLKPDDRTATLVNRGILEAAAGNTDAAIADYNAALERKQDAAEIYINRGSAFLRADRYSEARADFDHAIGLGSSNTAIAYFNRGVAKEKSGDVQGAFQDYKTAQAQSPDFQPAAIELARFHTVDQRVAAAGK